MRLISLIFLFTTLVLLVIGASGCEQTAQEANISVQKDNSSSTVSTISAAPTSAEVIIKNFTFNPPEITIAKGGKVLFINQDSIKHTITSYSAPSSFSHEIRPGISLTQSFEISGTYNYYCVFHPDMKGTVIVQ